MTDEEQASDAYEAAEAAFLSAVREQADRSVLAELASRVAAQAGQWNGVAYRQFHAAPADDRQDLDALTERTEVLSELWSDIAAAYRHVPETSQ